MRILICTKKTPKGLISCDLNHLNFNNMYWNPIRILFYHVKYLNSLKKVITHYLNAKGPRRTRAFWQNEYDFFKKRFIKRNIWMFHKCIENMNKSWLAWKKGSYYYVRTHKQRKNRMCLYSIVMKLNKNAILIKSDIES